MGLFDKFRNKKKHIIKMDIFDIPYDYDGYDLVFESGITEPNLYERFNQIVTNGKYDITSMSEYKELSISSDLDKFYKFYDCWLNNLRDNKYVYHLDNSVGIEQFFNGIYEILKKNGSNEKLDNKAIIQRYMNELKKYTYQGNEIESDFKYEILEANIIADELRKIGYELITFFNGFDNYDQTVVPISTIESLKSIESEIK